MNEEAHDSEAESMKSAAFLESADEFHSRVLYRRLSVAASDDADRLPLGTSRICGIGV